MIYDISATDLRRQMAGLPTPSDLHHHLMSVWRTNFTEVTIFDQFEAATVSAGYKKIYFWEEHVSVGRGLFDFTNKSVLLFANYGKWEWQRWQQRYKFLQSNYYYNNRNMDSSGKSVAALPSGGPASRGGGAEKDGDGGNTCYIIFCIYLLVS